MSILDGLPDSIRIGPFDHPVIIEKLESDEGRRYWGQHEHGQWIKIHPEQPNALFAVDTVLHEIIHGLDGCAGINAVDDDVKIERMASALATGLVQVFRDNPQLLAWITKSLGSTSSTTKTSPYLNSSVGALPWGAISTTTMPDSSRS